jgi:outer membrane protein TolC
MARAIKYQADYRQRQMEQAAATAQLDVSRFDMLPRIMMNAGYSNRNNDSFGFGFSPSGQIALNPSASSEREFTTGSIGFAWNLLDFGVSYFHARQLADQTLIGEERRRKALQTLMHDVRVAWWRAEAAQRLLPAADAMLAEIDRVSEHTRVIEARKLLPPQQTATLRRALLDLAQQISLRRTELAQAKVELAALVSVPPGSDIKVAAPASTEREVLDFTGDTDRLEVLALRIRPEIAEEGYRARISADEARKAIVGLLPGISFDAGSNYNSNKFLVNNAWNSAGVTVAWNLVKLFSLPAMKRSEEAQKEVDASRRLAMSMAVLAQTHLATVRYDMAADEFRIWDEAARDDDLIVSYIVSSARVGIDTEIELMRAKARALVSHMNRDLAYSVLQASMARVFHSIGYDAVPREEEGKTVADLARVVQARLTELEGENFSPPATPKVTAVAISVVKSASEHTAALLREGAKRVLDLAKVRLVEPDAAEVRLEMDATLEKPEDGKRSARVDIRVLRESGDSTAHFKTTMSEPVDDEQWRVLGEGAAYRVLDLFTSLRPWRPSSRPVEPAGQPVRSGEAVPVFEYPYPQGQPLMLSLERSLRSIGRAQNVAGVAE